MHRARRRAEESVPNESNHEDEMMTKGGTPNTETRDGHQMPLLKVDAAFVALGAMAVGIMYVFIRAFL